MIKITQMKDVPLKNKRVFIREDLNVPIKGDAISSTARIHAALPTIKEAIDAGAAVIIASHLGRPKKIGFDESLSLAPVAKELSKLLGYEIPLVKDWLTGVNVLPGNAVLCENVRFNEGEVNNDENLAKQMASLCDIYVMDAFATAHRVEASTCGIAKFAPIACGGPLLVREIEAIEQAINNPESPVVAIVGGAKVSTKLKLLDTLIKKVDTLIVGGGIANTFIAAQGYSVGKSLYEQDFIDEAERLLDEAKKVGKLIPIPTDVMVSEQLPGKGEAYLHGVDSVNEEERILDIGPTSQEQLAKIIKQANTILWNGPVGAFEFDAFSKGTQSIANAIAKSNAFSIAGGGDTLAAIEKYQIKDKISYISTGGGAFLACLEGKTLPIIEILQQRSDK